MADAIRLLTEIRDALRAPAVPARSSAAAPSTGTPKPFRPVYRGSRKRYPPPAIISQPARVPSTYQRSGPRQAALPYSRPISHPPALSGGSNVPALRNIFGIARQQAGDASQEWGQPSSSQQSSIRQSSGTSLAPVASGMSGAVGAWRNSLATTGGQGDGQNAVVQKLDEIINLLRDITPSPDTDGEVSKWQETKASGGPSVRVLGSKADIPDYSVGIPPGVPPSSPRPASQLNMGGSLSWLDMAIQAAQVAGQTAVVGALQFRDWWQGRKRPGR